jgi:hypothetical protein
MIPKWITQAARTYAADRVDDPRKDGLVIAIVTRRRHPPAMPAATSAAFGEWDQEVKIGLQRALVTIAQLTPTSGE